MKSKHSSSLGSCLAVIALSAAVCFGQGPVKKPSVRSDVKTTEPQVVAFTQGNDDLAEFDTIAKQAMEKLLGDVGKSGLTPVARYSMAIDFASVMAGGQMAAWEARVALVNAPPEGGEAEYEGFKVKALEPTEVAYTFHTGPFNAIEFTIQGLVGWMMQKGHTPGQNLTVVACGDPDQAGGDGPVIEIQIDVKAT